MIGNPQEEKHKDDILQKINDELEKLEWGGECKKMVLKITFEGRFNMRPIRAFKAYKTSDLTNRTGMI